MEVCGIRYFVAVLVLGFHNYTVRTGCEFHSLANGDWRGVGGVYRAFHYRRDYFAVFQ